MVAVVKENVGTEIEDFRPHFAGDIYIDEKVKQVTHYKIIKTIFDPILPLPMIGSKVLGWYV